MEPRVPGKQFLGKYAGGKLAQAVVGRPRSNASSKKRESSQHRVEPRLE
jgi:hypothetical protein